MLRMLGLALVVLIAPLAPGARAQEALPGCPDIDPPSASPTPLDAAEQVLCWYERNRRAEPGCASATAAPSSCIEHVAAWCDAAAMDADPQVPNACFVARVRLGRHDDAVRSLALIERAWPEVETCRAAYTEGLPLHVESHPAGAEVRVSGVLAGTSPTEVRLPAPWWRQTVLLRFGSGAQAADVTVRAPELEALFDPRSCVLATLVASAPEPPQATRHRRISAPPLAPADGADGDARSRGSRGPAVRWIVLGSAGLAAIAGGLVLLVAAQTTAGDLHDVAPGTPWTASRTDDLRRVEDFRLAGGLLLGAGTVAASTALIGWLTASQERVQRTRVTRHSSSGSGSLEAGPEQ